jgi:hypothetical protein
MRRLLTLATAAAALTAAAPAAAFIRPADARLDRATVDLRASRAAVPAAVAHARLALRRSLGPEGFLSTDRVTGGVRFLGSTDGYLSGPQAGTPEQIALRWAAQHLDVLGLTRADLGSFALVQRYTAPNGVTRLIFRQQYRGIGAFDNSLRVNVARDGRVVNVGGAPRHALSVPSVRPRLSAARALAAAMRAVGATSRIATLPARLEIVSTGPSSAVLAYRLWFEESSTAAWDVLVNAGSGAVLRTAQKVKFANGTAWDYYPGAAAGGKPRTVDYGPWLTAQDALSGNNTHVYNDFLDHEDCLDSAATGACTVDNTDPTQANGDLVLPDEEIRPDGVTGGNWTYDYSPVPSPAGFCPAAGCAWDHLVNGSWLVNRNQDGAQVFFFVNTYHDHLAAPPISFDEAAGNFQQVNKTGKGKGNDPVYASAMDAAGQVAGRPIPTITSDNANMLTRPDGQAPRMQMYLFEPVQAGSLLDYPFSDVSGGDDASVVYHEYTHGLTNRLVIDADGQGTLDGAQSGAMGEAWSDWYAMDFLQSQGFEHDTDKPGELHVGVFVDGGQNLVRTEPLDCTLGADAKACPRKRSGLASEGGGGYTYDDFGKIVPGGPEVHGDGEIWGQTLEDLRRRLVADHGAAEGARRAEEYVTRALTLSPDNPSYIDMRNAILQADMVDGGRDHTRIWQVFAPRGMGASASAKDGNDPAPQAAFDLPPNLPAPDTLSPTVTVDSPAEGAVVRAGTVQLAGTALDDTGVTSLTLDGAPIRHAGSTWTAAVTVRPGANAFTVVAGDVESHTATAVRHLIGDAAAPKLRAKLRRGRLTGRATDDTGVARVTVNGRRVKLRGGRFSARVRGAARVVVTDRAGRVVKRRLRG